MKFKDNKECRHVVERMDGILLPLKQYLNEDSAECVNIGMRILRHAGAEVDCDVCKDIEKNHIRIEYYWIDDEGNTASFQDKEKHIVATRIADYCPSCGRKLDYRITDD